MTALPAAIAPAQATAVGEVSPLFDAFVSELDASPRTAQTYARAIRQFGLWLARRGTSAPVRADIIAYRDAMVAEHRAGTARCYLVAVKMFFRWTAREGFYPNVAEDVRGVRVDSSTKRQALTSRQAHAILEGARGDASEAGLRNYAMLALLLSCGLRCIEAVRANVGDLRTVCDQTVLYVHGKGHSSADTFVQVPGQVEDAIRAYLVTRGRVDRSAPLFASTARRNPGGRLTTRTVSGIGKAALRSIGLETDCTHEFRHTAITLSLIQGKTLQEASQFARHASISTTQIYAHNLDRLRNGCASAVADAIF